jgi:hypothetical protein
MVQLEKKKEAKMIGGQSPWCKAGASHAALRGAKVDSFA